MISLRSQLAWFVLVACSVGCEAEPEPQQHQVLNVTAAPYGEPYEKLSEWHLFSANLSPAARVVPYSVISPLFSDYTYKLRFVYLPEGKTIAYDETKVWEFPVGTILIKMFGHPKSADSSEVTWRETRLLYREPDGWVPHTYVWNDEQTDAVRTVAGKFIPVEFEAPSGEAIAANYRVPNTNECKTCHATDDVVQPLGTRTRQLDYEVEISDHLENQLEYFVSIGWFAATPKPYAEREHLVDPQDESQDLFLRVRSYWDSNCAACHREGVEAEQTGLFLAFEKTAPESLTDNSTIGVCKTPTSPGGATCGNSLDIVPGDPDASIMICRMSVEEPKWRMPPLGSLVVHQEGLALMRDWVASLEPAGCAATP